MSGDSRRPPPSSSPKRPPPPPPPPRHAPAPAAMTPASPEAGPSRRSPVDEGMSSPARGPRSSPSASSSQGDMADTEMEGGPHARGGGGEPSSSASAPEGQGPPAKKKRTRTLTTPHQSAVLHALLAQSRFPTTAMREEVGRAIGLSARKVQIWFQNQRQKARRPRGQATATAPLTRPPQFGPFSNMPPASASIGAFPPDLSPTTTTLHSGSSADGLFPLLPPASADPDRFAYRRDPRDPREPFFPEPLQHRFPPPFPEPDRRDARDPREPFLPLPQLAGPGMPGARHTRSAGGPSWGAHAPPPPHPQSRPATMGDLFNFGAPRPLAVPASAPEPSRTELTLAPVHPSRSPPAPTLAPFRSLDLPFGGRLPPPVVSASPPRLSLNIPPPFTLQPRPQWDDPAFSPFTRRSRRSPPPLPPPGSPPEARAAVRASRRFDPVRASPPRRGPHEPDDPSASTSGTRRP